MRRGRRGRDEAALSVYARIVAWYTAYVLVRCARYTNERTWAQQIGVYTLIGACQMARVLGRGVPPGRILEIVLGVVGPDVLAGARGEDWHRQNDIPLIADAGMRKVAQALNALERSVREALVLHHVSGIGPQELARFLEEPVAEVRARIARGERLLAERLGRARAGGRKAGGSDVQSLLTDFAARLDGGWIMEVAAGALDYLTASGCQGPHRRHRASGSGN